MTIFDLIALGVIALSALSGFNRGAVAELVGLFAMALSAIATIALLPLTAPIMRHFMHAGWLSAVAAAVVTFVVIFLFLRLLAASLTHSVNRSLLGGANRFGGLLFGAIRGVVFLGLIALVFNRATPEALKPAWITDALTYPLATDAGRALQTFLPKTFDLTGGFGGKLTDTITRESTKSDDETAPTSEVAPPSENTSPSEDAAPLIRHDPPSSERVKPTNHGYTKHARDSVDALVERSK